MAKEFYRQRVVIHLLITEYMLKRGKLTVPVILIYEDTDIN
jgi:hypothetical protein